MALCGHLGTSKTTTTTTTNKNPTPVAVTVAMHKLVFVIGAAARFKRYRVILVSFNLQTICQWSMMRHTKLLGQQRTILFLFYVQV
jgi:hypothetical protein